MITKRVEWLGVQLDVEYTHTADCVVYTSIALVNVADLQSLLERLLAVVPCEEHIIHVIPALSHLGEVLEPSAPATESVPVPTAPGGRMMN